MPYDPLASRIDRSQIALQDLDDPFRWPRSQAEWSDRYQYLLNAYNGETYDQQIVKSLALFRALDDDGKIIAVTRRLHRDRQFIVDTAVAALGLDQITIVANDGANPDDVETARAIWRRSQPDEFAESWSRTLAIMGDLFVEPVRMTGIKPYGVRLVSHDPRTVYSEYDALMGIFIERAIITHKLLGEASVDIYGNVTELAALTTYQRTLTPEEITQETSSVVKGIKQQEADEGGSGPHGLGVTPLVHVRCIPSPSEPEHGLPCTHGADRPIAEVDSIMSLISAVGDRYANPKLVIKGPKIADDSKISRFGRIINIWGGSKEILAMSDAKYLEPSLAGIGVLSDRLEGLIRDVRTTFPEFLFLGGGSTANLSGEALRLLSTLYVSKYDAIRRRLYGGIARALAMGCALEKDQPFDPDYMPVRIEGPPLLPNDTKAELEALMIAKQLGAISQVDIVRHAQRLGVASDEQTAEAYAFELLDMAADRAATFFDAGTQADLTDPEYDTGEDEQSAEETPPAASNEQPEEKQIEAVQMKELAMNGAQVASAQSIVQSVAERRLPRATGIAMLAQFFNIEAPAAEAIMGDVGRSFFIELEDNAGN